MKIITWLKGFRLAITSFFISGLMMTFGCEDSLDGSDAFQEKFIYEDNHYSWAYDLVQLKNGEGFLLLVHEGYEPFGSSILKLDNEFNVVWKKTLEFTYFTQLHELSNGEILLIAERVIYKMKPDGSEFNRIESILAESLRVLDVNNELLIYGIDTNYKLFIARYNSEFEKEAELNLNSRYVSINAVGEIFTINNSSIQQHSFTNGLVKEMEIDLGDFWVTDFKMDKDNNFLVLGITAFRECCCNDKIGFVKFSPSGKKLWSRRVGSLRANNYSSTILIEDDEYSISGMYGEDTCIDREGFDGNYNDMFALKIRKDGTIKKSYIFGRPSADDGLSKIIKANGHYYAIGGFSFSSDSPAAVIYQLKHF